MALNGYLAVSVGNEESQWLGRRYLKLSIAGVVADIGHEAQWRGLKSVAASGERKRSNRNGCLAYESEMCRIMAIRRNQL
jgi:hypothetical protein